MPTSELTRFLARADCSGGPSACWLWLGPIAPGGYGKVSIGSRRDGTNGVTGAHRRAWELAHGPIPAGLHVLHRCDVPACVNPAHLFLGTHKDNMHDMSAKGRARGGCTVESAPKGEKHGCAKLSPQQVIAIRTAFAAGHGSRALAASYGISRSAVELIVLGKRWRHVPMAEA